MKFLLKLNTQKKWKDITAHTEAARVKEADIHQCLIQHLNSVLHFKKSRHEFNVLLYKLFHCGRLHDSALAKQLSTNYTNLKQSIDTWFDGKMESN